MHRGQRKFVRGRRLRYAFPIGSRRRGLASRWAGGLGGVRWSPSPQWAPETGLKMVRGVGQTWTENKCNQRWLAGGPGRRPRRSTHHAPPASGADHRTFRGATIFPPSTCDRCEAIQKHRTTRPSWRFPESPGRRGGERGAERARVGTSPWWFNLECSLIALPFASACTAVRSARLEHAQVVTMRKTPTSFPWLPAEIGIIMPCSSWQHGQPGSPGSPGCSWKSGLACPFM